MIRESPLSRPDFRLLIALRFVRELQEMYARTNLGNCVRGLSRSRQATLADGEIAIHQIIAILLGVRVIKSQLVTHLMLDRGKQIHVARWRAGWSRIKTSCGSSVSEILIGGADEPALAAGIAINQHEVPICFAQIRVCQISDFKVDAA